MIFFEQEVTHVLRAKLKGYKKDYYFGNCAHGIEQRIKSGEGFFPSIFHLRVYLLSVL